MHLGITDRNLMTSILRNSYKEPPFKLQEFQSAYVETEQELHIPTKENTAIKMENSAFTSKCILFNQLQEENLTLQSSNLKYPSEL